MISFFKSNLLFSYGISIVWCLVIAGIISFFIYRPLLFVIFGLFIFSLYFFRNPKRVCIEAVQNDMIIMSPADGKVVAIHRDAPDMPAGYTHKISIYLSPFDVHVNWIPLSGVIQKIEYRPGTFTFAFLPKSSEFNEHNDVYIQGDGSKKMVVRQIAGAVARRICWWVKSGQQVAAGTTYGMIRFGSRVDVLFPDSVIITARVGQRVYGGQSVIGRWV